MDSTSTQGPSTSLDHLPVALPSRTFQLAAAISVALVVIDLVAAWLLDDRTDMRSQRWQEVTGLENSHGMAVWWSSVLFLLVALLAYTRSRDPLAAAAGSMSWRWKLLAGLFLWTSFDHATHAHVEAARLGAGYLHVPEGAEPLTLLLLVTAGFAGVPLFRAASQSARRWLAFAAVALVASASGVDATLHVLDASPGLASRAAETVLEWAGLVAFVKVLIDPTAWHGSRSRPGGT